MNEWSLFSSWRNASAYTVSDHGTRSEYAAVAPTLVPHIRGRAAVIS